MQISPECSNCTKAISEGKANPHIHQFPPEQTRRVRKTRWFSVLLLLQLWAGSRPKLLHMPSSHQDLHQRLQHVCRGRKASNPILCFLYVLSPCSHGFWQVVGYKWPLPCLLSWPILTFPRAALSSTRNLKIKLLIFVPSILVAGHSCTGTNDGMNYGVCCYIKLYHSHN